jgi:hypothetical protein
MLVLFTPGGIEELFRQNAGSEPVERIARANKFGTRITGPALFDDLVLPARFALDRAKSPLSSRY